MTRFDPDEMPVEVRGSGHITISTADAGRAVLFYWRVFGFRAIAWPGRDGTPRLLMHAPGGPCLAICEQRGVTSLPQRLQFRVHDLDEARERLWDLGVALADGSIGPRFDAGRCCRSLHVRDPDGNHVELGESAVALAPSPGRRAEVSALSR